MEADVRAYAARMRRVPPDQDRLRLTRQLEATTGASAFAVELVAGMAATMGRALDPLVPPEARMKPGELDGTIALGTAELAEVVAFYEFDAGQ